MKKKALGPSWWRRNTQSSGLCWCYGDRRHTGRGPSCEEEKGRRARCNERPDAHPPPPQFLFARRERSLSSLSFFPNRPPIRPVLSPLPSILLLFLKKKQTKLRAISFVCCFFFSDQEAVKTHDRREPDKNKRETKPGQHQIFPFTVDVVPSLHDRKKSGNHFDSRLPHFVCVCVERAKAMGTPPPVFSNTHTASSHHQGHWLWWKIGLLRQTRTAKLSVSPYSPKTQTSVRCGERALADASALSEKKQHKIFIFE